ncbi:unnamed protein product, partial [Brenthis ino]
MFCCERISSIFFLLVVIGANAKQYRPDYTYDRKLDAFYKFHIESVRHLLAEDICKIEGAKLMAPANDREISLAHGMFKQFPDIVDFAWIGENANGKESKEEHPLIDYSVDYREHFLHFRRNCDVLTRDGEVQSSDCYRRLPFFCKVDARDVFFDSKCKVYGKDYQFYENVGSCYKVPQIAYSWDQAYDECYNEGSHLVILNSELEHDVVHNITKTAPKLTGVRTSWSFYAGIRAPTPPEGKPVVFKTIFNQTLEEAGYSQWSVNEPNNYDGLEYCGSIFKNDGKYNDLKCSHLYAFICEKEVKND